MNGTPVDLATIKKTCYFNIESKTPSTIDWTNMIGQGTYGIILGTIIDDDWVVKVANKKDSCTVMDHEYNFHREALEALRFVKERNSDIPVFCPEIRDFLSIDTCCWYYMSKIYNDEK